MLPFVVNCLALTGVSYEAESLDWRIWVLNMLLGGMLCIASSVQYHQAFDSSELSLIGVGLLISVVGAMTTMKERKNISQKFARQVTLVKVIVILIAVGLIIWAVLWWKGTTGYTLLAQIICGASVALSACASMVFLKEDRKQVGVGSPLLWLFLRMILAAGIDAFWLWALLCLVSFAFLNFLHKRVNLFGAIRNHWINWQRIESFNASVTLTGAMAIFLLVLNGSNATIAISPPIGDLLVGNLERSLTPADSFGESACGGAAIWRALAAANYAEKARLTLEDPMILHKQTIEHFMFEESASVAMVALLLVSSVSGYLRKAKDPKSTQGAWQPIFFFSTAILILIISYNDYEVIGYISGWMTVTWADDSLMAISLSFFFFVFSFLVSAYKFKGGGEEKIKREKTPFESFQMERFRILAVVLICLLFVIALLCFGQYFQVFPRQRFLEFTYDGRAEGEITDPANFSSSIVVDRLESFLREADRNLLTQAGLNCTSRDSCITSLSVLEAQNSCPNATSDLDEPFFVGVNTLVGGDMAYKVQFGLSDLLDREILALGVLTLCSIALLMAALMYPVVDDFGMAVTGASSTVMAIAVPYSIRELRSPRFHGTIGEWFIPILGMLQFLSCCASILVRVESPHKFKSPWVSLEDLQEAYESSPFTEPKLFVQEYIKCEIEGTTLEELFGSLARKEKDDDVADRRGLVPEYTNV